MTKLIKVFVAALIAIFAVGSLSSCSSNAPIDMANVAAVIDVRTPGEFATGHLEGALNYDIQGSSFVSEINAIDRAANYVIYCRSGNRAGQAITYMQDHGFTGTLTNAGGVDEAASVTGLSIVQ